MGKVSEELQKDITCNLCGLSCQLKGFGVDMPDLSHGMLEVKISGGYDSTPGNGRGALDDMTVYEFSLCEFCLDWIFEQCVIPPVTYAYHNSYTPEEFRSASERVKNDEWRKMKDEFFAEKKRRDVNRKEMFKLKKLMKK